MPDVVLFSDVEAGLAPYLAPLIGQRVESRVPNPRPTTFLRVQRTGGVSRDLVVDQAQVTVEAWAGTDTAAAALAGVARAHLLAMARAGAVLDGGRVLRVDEVSGLNNDPDPDSGSRRYVFTVLIHVRGHRLP